MKSKKHPPAAHSAQLQALRGGGGSQLEPNPALAPVPASAVSGRKLRPRGAEEDSQAEKLDALTSQRSPGRSVAPGVGVEEKGKLAAKLRSGRVCSQDKNKQDWIESKFAQPSSVDEPPIPCQPDGQCAEGSNPGTLRKRKGGRGSLSTTMEVPRKEVANCLVSKKDRHETTDINVSTEEVGVLSRDPVDISGELFSKGAKRAEIERTSDGGDIGEEVAMKASSERNLRHRGREEDAMDAKPKKSPGRKAKSGIEEGGQLAKLTKGQVCFQEKTKQEDQFEFNCAQYSSKEEACIPHPKDGQPAEGSSPGTSGKRKGGMGSLSTTMELPRKEVANRLVSKKKHIHKTIEINASTEEVGALSRDPVDISRELFSKGAKKAEIERGSSDGDTRGVEVTVSSKRNLCNREREEDALTNKMDVKPRKSPGRKAKSGVEEGGQLAKIRRGQVQEDQVEFKHAQSSPKEEAHVPHLIDGQPAEGSSPGISRKRKEGRGSLSTTTQLLGKEVVNHMVSKKKHRHETIEIDANTEEMGALSRDPVDICGELCSEGTNKADIELGNSGGDTRGVARVASSKRNLCHKGSEEDALTDNMDAKPKKSPGRKAKPGLEEGGQPAKLRSGQVCFQEKTKQEDQVEFACAQSSAKEAAHVSHLIDGQLPEGSSSPGTSRKRKGGRGSLLGTTELPKKEVGNHLVSKKKHRHETIDINVSTEKVGALSRESVDIRRESFAECALNAGDPSMGLQTPREESLNIPLAPKNKRRHNMVEINVQSKEVEILSKDPTIISGQFLSKSVVNAEGADHHDKKDDPSVGICILRKEGENRTVTAGDFHGKMDDPSMGLQIPREESVNAPHIPKNKCRHKKVEISAQSKEAEILSKDPTVITEHLISESVVNAEGEHHHDKKDDPSVGICVLRKEGENRTVTGGDFHGKMDDASMGLQIPREESVNAPHIPKNKRRHKKVEISAQSKEAEILSKDPTVITEHLISESVVYAEGEHHHDKKDDPSVGICVLRKEGENRTVTGGDFHGKMDDASMGLQIPREESVNAPHIPKNKRRHKKVEISAQSKEAEILSKDPTVITEHLISESVVNAEGEHHHDKKDDPSVGICVLRKEGENRTVTGGDFHGKMDDASMGLQIPREESVNAPHIPKNKRRHKKVEISAQSKEAEILSKDPTVIIEHLISESVVYAEGEHHHDKKDDPSVGIQILRKVCENGTTNAGNHHGKMDDPSMSLQIPREESVNAPHMPKNKRRHKKVEISAQSKEGEILSKDPTAITEQFLSESVVNAEGEHHHNKKDDPSVGIQILRKEGENGTTNAGNHHGKIDNPSMGLQIPREESMNAPHMPKTKRRHKKVEITAQSKEMETLLKDPRVITGQLLSESVLNAGGDQHHDKKDGPSAGIQILTKEDENETVNTGDHQGEMDDPSMGLENSREENVNAPHFPKNNRRGKTVEISAQSKEVEIPSKDPMVITAQFLSESVVNAGGEHQHSRKDDSSVSIQKIRKEDKNGTVLKKKLKSKKIKTNASKEQLDALSTERSDIKVQFLSESVANAGEPHEKMDLPSTSRQILREEGVDDSVLKKKCEHGTVEISACTEVDISGRLLAEGALNGGEQHEKMEDPSMGIQIPREEVVNVPAPKRKRKRKTVEISASREEMNTLSKDPLDNTGKFVCEGEQHEQTDDLSIMGIQMLREEVLNKTVKISANTKEADISGQFLSKGCVNDGVKMQSLRSDLDEVINDQVQLEGTQFISAELQLNGSANAKGSEGVRTSKRERKKSHRWLEYEVSNMDYMQDGYAEILNPECGTVDEDGTPVVKAEKKGRRQSDLKCEKKIEVPSNDEGQGLDENDTAHDPTSGLSLDATDTLTQQCNDNLEKPSKARKRKSDHIKELPLGDSPTSHPRKSSKVHKNNFGHEKETPRKQKSKSIASSTDGSEKSAKKASANGNKTDVESTKKVKGTISRGIKFVGNGDVNPTDPGLDLSKLTMKEIIWVAEAKEKQLKENASSKERETAGQTSASQAEELFQQEERASFAPQVQVIDGRIVINQESLTISAGRPNEVENFKRVEETHSKLNYHSYLKKLPRLKWTKEDTELFYKAIQQFGTDFGLIKNLFPGKSRRHIVLKFKKEERLHPLRLSDAMTRKPEDTTEYEKVMNILNLSLETTAEQANDTSEAWEDPFVTQADGVVKERAAEEEFSGVDLEEQSSPEAEKEKEKEKEKVKRGSHDNVRVAVGTKVEYSSSFNASVNIQEKYEAITQKYEDLTQKSEIEDHHLSAVSKPKSLFSYQNLNPSKPRSLFSYQQL